MNEIIFFGWAIFTLMTVLVIFRLGGFWGVVITIAVYSLLMNIFVLKQFDLFGWALTGGNMLYGAIFLGTDLLSEHYGKKMAIKAVWIGFTSTIFFVIASQVLLAFIPNSEDFAHTALSTLFSIAPRILLGSLLAFIVAQLLDVWLYEKIRTFFPKQLWGRNLGSTLVSQAIDTIIFTAVGLTSFAFLPFEGVISTTIFWEVCFATYVIKVVVALFDTPFIYASRWVKK